MRLQNLLSGRWRNDGVAKHAEMPNSPGALSRLRRTSRTTILFGAGAGGEEERYEAILG